MEVREKLTSRVEKERELLSRSLRSDSDLEQAKVDYRKWNDYNTELLRQLFNSTLPNCRRTTSTSALACL